MRRKSHRREATPSATQTYQTSVSAVSDPEPTTPSSSAGPATSADTWRAFTVGRTATRRTVVAAAMLATVAIAVQVALKRWPDATVEEETAVLLITHSRDAYLSRAIWSVLLHHPRTTRRAFPLFISQDHAQPDVSFPLVTAEIDRARDLEQFVEIIHLIHRPSNVSEPSGKDVTQSVFVDSAGYRRISRHYHWAISQVFEHTWWRWRGWQQEKGRFARVIIVEDDMEVAVDFFEYFAALAPVLDQDKTLLSVSAWNDNGKPGLASDPSQLHRTDWFPGLGWMLRRSLWEGELSAKWPEAFWDDWMRDPSQHKGRQSIRPEISRTLNFGARGVSRGSDFDKHIASVVVNVNFTRFSALDLGYLGPDAYEQLFFGRVARATLLRYTNHLDRVAPDSDAIVRFSPGKLEAVGRKFGLMCDHRLGVWRGAYRGVVVVRSGGRWLFFFPRGQEGDILPPGVSFGHGAECC